MNLDLEELNIEKEYLKKTLEIINKLLDNDNSSIENRMSQILEIKKYIWENSSVLDDVEISSSMYNINNDVQSTNDQIKKMFKLKKSLSTPYFGRIDFEYDGTVDQFYIGINGIIDNYDFYVYDWRTPVASLFYNYGIGNSSYEAPKGLIEGHTTLKRQYKVKNGILERCFNSDLNIDDEYLQEILAKSSGEKMTNIVNSIQKEQNEIVRNIIDKILIVQGIAGSGKTSVALHRIAYLLYKEKNLSSNNILIFSPNDVFTEYISEVLPELGEENVLQTTFSDFAKSYLPIFNNIETFSEYIERCYSQTQTSENQQIIKKKFSNQFKIIIDESIKAYNEKFSFVNSLKLNECEYSIIELNKLFKDRFAKIPLIARFDRIAEYLCDTQNISFKRNGKIISDKLRNSINVSLDIITIYNSVLMKIDSGLTIENNYNSKVKYEDLIPLLYIFFKLNGYNRSNAIKQVIIDEAQDYNLIQFKMLKEIFQTASFTILGDINQTINPNYFHSSLSTIGEIFDKKTRYLELNKTYRSSQEIIEYSNSILNLDYVSSIRKSNSIPVILKTVSEINLLECLLIDINAMKNNNLKRIAIVTKNDEQTSKIFEILKPHLDNVKILNEGTKFLNEDILILPSYISKGLEFDGVISYTDLHNEYTEEDKYLYYVVCTRAQHELTVYNPKQLVRK